MMVKINNEVGKWSEWCILEFQGEIVVPDGTEVDGKFLGNLELLEVKKMFRLHYGLLLIVPCYFS